VINTHASPLFLSEDIQYILDTEELDLRTRLALEDVKCDLECIQEFITALDKFDRGHYSEQTLRAAYNLYISRRGSTRLKD